MSSHEMTALVPLYALDALESSETADFEAHLETCPECRAALDGYRADISGLVLDEPASTETWLRISEAINAESSVTLPAPDHRRTWQWVASMAAAAALVLGGLLVAQLLNADDVTSDDVVVAAQQAEAEEGAVVGDFLVEDVSVARVVVAPDGRGYVIPTEDLEALDPTMAYQLWVVNDTEDVISAGVLGSDPAPSTFTWTGNIAGFALTREVAGGVVSSAGDVVSVIADV